MGWKTGVPCVGATRVCRSRCARVFRDIVNSYHSYITRFVDSTSGLASWFDQASQKSFGALATLVAQALWKLQVIWVNQKLLLNAVVVVSPWAKPWSGQQLPSRSHRRSVPPLLSSVEGQRTPFVRLPFFLGWFDRLPGVASVWDGLQAVTARTCPAMRCSFCSNSLGWPSLETPTASLLHIAASEALKRTQLGEVRDNLTTICNHRELGICTMEGGPGCGKSEFVAQSPNIRSIQKKDTYRSH